MLTNKQIDIIISINKAASNGNFYKLKYLTKKCL